MSWDEVGAIGQLLGSVAVFITLAYLSIQTRHARQESRRALGLSRAEALRDMYALSSDERINRLITKAYTALDVAPLPMQDALMEQAGFNDVFAQTR